MSTFSRHAPRHLWLIAQAFLQTFFALFGDPSAIATKHTLTHKPRALMLPWLRAGEALLRRLLLIEASAIVQPNAPPSSRNPRPRQRKLMSFTPEHPEKWRVSFRCLERRLPAGKSVDQSVSTAIQNTSCRLEAGAPRRISRENRWSHENFAPVRFHSAWPLAERAEALLRVFNDPAPYARRLARRLHVTPQRTRAIARYPANAPNLIGRDAFAKTSDPTEAAIRRFSSA